MSPESCAERGTGGHGPTADSAQDDTQKKKLEGWTKFADKKDNDPRSMAHARSADHGLAIWPVSVHGMNLVLGYLYRLTTEAEKKVVECLEPWSEEWRELMDELVMRQHTLNKEFLITAKVLALPKPTHGAMISAAKELAEFDPDWEFPFDLEPDYHRYLEKMDEVHRILRSILASKTLRLFFPWMPEREGGHIDIRRLDATATIIKNVLMAVLCLGPFGLVLFKGVSDTWIKIVLFVAAAVGVATMLMADGTKKHALVLMAVMASVVFGDSP